MIKIQDIAIIVYSELKQSFTFVNSSLKQLISIAVSGSFARQCKQVSLSRNQPSTHSLHPRSVRQHVANITGGLLNSWHTRHLNAALIRVPILIVVTAFAIATDVSESQLTITFDSTAFKIRSNFSFTPLFDVEAK